MVEWPVIFLWKDTGRLQYAADLGALMHLIEFNDVEFQELMMWDATGRVLDYGNNSEGKLWIAISDRPKSDLIVFLKRNLKAKNLPVLLADELPATHVIDKLNAD